MVSIIDNADMWEYQGWIASSKSSESAGQEILSTVPQTASPGIN